VNLGSPHVTEECARILVGTNVDLIVVPDPEFMYSTTIWPSSAVVNTTSGVTPTSTRRPIVLNYPLESGSRMPATRSLLGCTWRRESWTRASQAPASPRTTAYLRQHRSPRPLGTRSGGEEVARLPRRRSRSAHTRSELWTGTMGARRAWTLSMISALSMPWR
jgi:hypothetical protein